MPDGGSQAQYIAKMSGNLQLFNASGCMALSCRFG
jgi:hypothetical protein